jgi:hypothetical protein
MSSRVEIGGLSNHLPIVLEISKAGKNKHYPLKFNQDWLNEEDYRKFGFGNLDPSGRGRGEVFHATDGREYRKNQESDNLWAKEFRKKQAVEIVALEEKISSLMMANEDGSLSDQEEATLKELMCKKHDFLRKEESKWRQKSRAVWIKEGDSNTNFFINSQVFAGSQLNLGNKE